MGKQFGEKCAISVLPVLVIDVNKGLILQQISNLFMTVYKPILIGRGKTFEFLIDFN